MRSLLGRVILVVGFSLSSLWIRPATPFWLAEFLLKDPLLTLWGFSCVICCFSLAAFNIFSLYLIFDSLINMCQSVSPWIYSICDSLHFLDLIDDSLSHVREVFNYNLFKYFLRPFLFLFFFWDPYNSNVGVFNVVSEVSKTVLNSFHSFSFILLCGSYFHYFIFQVTYPFFCLSYSAIDSFYRFLNFIYCGVHHCLFAL